MNKIYISDPAIFFIYTLDRDREIERQRNKKERERQKKAEIEKGTEERH